MYFIMKKTLFGISILLVLLEVSCSKAEQSVEEAAALTDSASIISSSVISPKTDSLKNMVIATEMKFKVNSVVKATYHIEDVTRKNGGKVVFTELRSEIHENNTNQISVDSALETTKYTTQNVMKLRIPNNKLDTSLREIARQISFFDYRVIKVDDVTIELLGNRLEQKRNEKGVARILNSDGDKVKANNENLGVEFQEIADNAKIANLILQDKVKMSTVEINIYQNPQTMSKTIANIEKPIGYGKSLGFEIVSSIKFGWVLIETIFVFVLKLWSLFLVFGIGFYFRKKLSFFNGNSK
jgi:Domain of unknown function (DUF4349)